MNRVSTTSYFYYKAGSLVNTRENNEGTRSPADYHHPTTVEELTQRNVEVIAQLEAAAQSKINSSDKIIHAITSFCGSMPFVWLHAVWFGGWLLWNGLLPIKHFDPHPYPVLTLIVALEAIFLATFILISQNHEAKIIERRSHLDLQINLLTEQENTKILSLLMQIAEKLEVDISSDPDVRILEEATRPEQLIEQIEQIIQNEEDAEAGDGN